MLKAWAALEAKARPDGTLVDICPATHQGDRASYLNRARVVDDVHGYGRSCWQVRKSCASQNSLPGNSSVKTGDSKEHAKL